MMNAALNGHKDIVEYLVGQGADKDIKGYVRTNHVHVPSYVCRQMDWQMDMDMDMYILHVYICLSVSWTSICLNDVMYVYVTLPVM